MTIETKKAELVGENRSDPWADYLYYRVPVSDVGPGGISHGPALEAVRKAYGWDARVLSTHPTEGILVEARYFLGD